MALFTFVSFVLFVLDSGFKYASQMPGKALSLMRMGRNPARIASRTSKRAAPVRFERRYYGVVLVLIVAYL